MVAGVGWGGASFVRVISTPGLVGNGKALQVGDVANGVGHVALTYVAEVLQDVRDEFDPQVPIIFHIQVLEHLLEALDGLLGNVLVGIEGAADQGREEGLQTLILEGRTEARRAGRLTGTHHAAFRITKVLQTGSASGVCVS